VEDEAEAQVEKIESDILAYISSLSECYKASLKGWFSPKAGELVAYYCNISKKWIRCEVDDSKAYNEETTFILWAIDYAVPFYTKSSYNIIPLMEKFRRPRGKTIIGGLGLMPASIRFEHESGKFVKDIKETWHDRAVKLMERFATKTTEIFFIPSTKCSHFEVFIGDLYFDKKSLSMRLVEDELAVTVPQNLFLKYFAKLFTNHIERWNDNSRKGGVLKNAEGIPHPKAFTIENIPEVPENASVVSSYTEEAKRKVAEWQARNAEMSEPEDFESIVSYQGMHNINFDSRRHTSPILQRSVGDFTDNSGEVDYSGIPAKELCEMLEKHLMPQQEEVKIRDHPRKFIIVPAGGGMCTNEKFPAYESIKSCETPNLTTVNSLSSEFNFVSVSQVGSQDAQAMEESAQHRPDEDNGIFQFDSMDSMNVIMERVQI
jgi:hypothetical protein